MKLFWSLSPTDRLMATIATRLRMLMSQNSMCTLRQKLSGMCFRNHCVAPHFWRWISPSAGGQFLLRGGQLVLLPLPLGGGGPGDGGGGRLVLLPLRPLGGGGPGEAGGVRLVPRLRWGLGGPGGGGRLVPLLLPPLGSGG